MTQSIAWDILTIQRIGISGTDRNAFINDDSIICMAKPRKSGNKFTTISISWEDKTLLRRFAEKKKTTKHGDVYESDGEVLHKLLKDLSDDPKLYEQSHPTYPSRPQDESQPN